MMISQENSDDFSNVQETKIAEIMKYTLHTERKTDFRSFDDGGQPE